MATENNIITYGGILNTNTPIAWAANKNAIETICGELISEGILSKGKYLTWDDIVYTSGTITFPHINGIPLPFGIIGNDITTKLVNWSPGYAIVVSGIKIHDTIQKLFGIDISAPQGNGVLLHNQGHLSSVERLQINNCLGTGLIISNCKANYISESQLFSNNVGCRLLNCTHPELTAIDSSYNRTDGIEIDNSTELYGNIRLTNNRRYGLNANYLTYSAISLFSSNNGIYQENNQIQNRRRNCVNNIFFGEHQVASNLAWADDEISHVSNLDYNDFVGQSGLIANWPYINLSGIVVGYNDPNELTCVYNNINGTNTIVLKSNIWSVSPINKHIKLATWPNGGLNNIAYNANDYFLIQANISGNIPEQITGPLATGNPYPILKIFSTQANIVPSGQPFYITRAGLNRYFGIFKANGAGTGFNPCIDISRSGMPTGPASDIVIFVNNISVQLISNSRLIGS